MSKSTVSVDADCLFSRVEEVRGSDIGPGLACGFASFARPV